MAAPPQNRILLIGFPLAVILSAFLLFQVQPIICRVLLPWFGGGPNVWTTCMLVFQWLLFAGYAYAHFLTSRTSARLQTAIHLGVLCLGVALLPILPSDDWKPTSSEHPWFGVITIVLANVGFPFFILSTSGPLLQAWFTKSLAGRSPYHLYALSNAGSLIALISYPFLVEPTMTLALQSKVWSVLFVAFASLCAIVVITSLAGRNSQQQVAEATQEQSASTPRPARKTMVIWFLLGTIPSIMSLATTNKLCADVAPIPFLWIAPLSLYLLSFILCFESERWYSRRLYSWVFSVCAVIIVICMPREDSVPLMAQVVVYCFGLFSCSMLCHGELSRLKPDPQFLTQFFLILAVGGASGGVFVSLIAPFLFTTYVEIHLVICATFLVSILTARYESQTSATPTSWVQRVQWPIALATVAGLTYSLALERRSVTLAVRNFYGVMRIREKGNFREVLHGRISHGRQFLAPEMQQIPTSYYGERSGVGLVMRSHQSDRPRHIGVVGLGAGTLAAYGREGDRIRFYELDPDMVRLAQAYFTFLKNCKAECQTIVGDARLSMEAEIESGETDPFDILAVDAFSGNAIPVHLLTREAVQLYLRHLRPDGVLAIHISNRHLDLAPVIAACVREEKLVSRLVAANPDGKSASQFGESPSNWVLISRDTTPFEGLEFRSLPPVSAPQEVTWTDDYSSLAAVLSPQDFQAFFRDFRLLGRGKYDHFIGQGIASAEDQNWDVAEKAFRNAIAEYDGDAGAWLHLGNVLRRQQQINEAKSCYQKAIELDAGYSEAHANFGALSIAHDLNVAERHLRLAIQLEPRNAEAHTSLGNLLVRLGQRGEAIEHYKIALAIKPSLEAAKRNLSLISGKVSNSQ